MQNGQSAISRDWYELNQLLKTADEKECHKLLAEEYKNKKRKQYLLRIHSRLNYVRAHRERDQIERGEKI